MDHSGREDEEPLTPTQRHSNVFGDENEVLDVADGFRPDNDIDSDEDSTQHTVSAHYASSPVMAFSPDRSSRRSTRKTRSSFDNPFASPNDNHATTLLRTPSARSSNYAPGIAGRSFSSSSSQQYAATNSPRLAGIAGPSHPYTMYPQGTIIRSPSVATASTTRPARRSTSLRGGPQHPYGMYTQGIVDSEDDEEDEERAANPVPVGFGLAQTYRRVRGPEGEEQDIIGEYGHAEQLPPYSRYPDEGPEKVPVLAVPEGIHSRAPVEGTDPGMPLMHQQMSRQSMTDASQLEQSVPLLPADNVSVHVTEEAPSSLGERSWKEKSWKEKRKTKICGVPLGWILIALACVGVAFAILIGSLVGYMAGTRNQKNTTSAADISTSTFTSSLYDASIIATPSGAGPLSGPFALTLGAPQATRTGCLVSPTQRPAWDCNLAGKPAVVMSIGLPPIPTPSLSALIFYSSDDTNISYGAQYQFMQTNPNFSPLIPVRDNDNPELGPAYYFQSTYNKVVVVPGNTFPIPGHSKRQAPQRPEWTDDWSRRKQPAMSGDQPWFCFFNNTALEGFIYVQRKACLNVTSSSLPTSVMAMATTTSIISSTTKTTHPMTSPTATNFAQSWPSAHSVDSNGIGTRDIHHPINQWANLYPYPSLVKLEERRLPNSTTPYCQLYQILDDGAYNMVPDNKGAPIMFYLDEDVPSLAPKEKRAAAADGCHCQWMHGEA